MPDPAEPAPSFAFAGPTRAGLRASWDATLAHRLDAPKVAYRGGRWELVDGATCDGTLEHRAECVAAIVRQEPALVVAPPYPPCDTPPARTIEDETVDGARRTRVSVPIPAMRGTCDFVPAALAMAPAPPRPAPCSPDRDEVLCARDFPSRDADGAPATYRCAVPSRGGAPSGCELLTAGDGEARLVRAMTAMSPRERYSNVDDDPRPRLPGPTDDRGAFLAKMRRELTRTLAGAPLWLDVKLAVHGDDGLMLTAVATGRASTLLPGTHELVTLHAELRFAPDLELAPSLAVFVRAGATGPWRPASEAQLAAWKDAVTRELRNRVPELPVRSAWWDVR